MFAMCESSETTCSFYVIFVHIYHNFCFTGGEVVTAFFIQSTMPSQSASGRLQSGSSSSGELSE